MLLEQVAAIALASDIRIAAESARFAFLFPRVGIASTDLGVCWLLPRVIGLGKAAELLLLGDTINAKEAEQIGLVNRVVPDDELLKTAEEIAQRFASFSPLGSGMTKDMLYKELSMDYETAIDLEGWIMSLSLHTDDSKEGARALGAKRPPVFKGK